MCLCYIGKLLSVKGHIEYRAYDNTVGQTAEKRANAARLDTGVLGCHSKSSPVVGPNAKTRCITSNIRLAFAYRACAVWSYVGTLAARRTMHRCSVRVSRTLDARRSLH